MEHHRQTHHPSRGVWLLIVLILSVSGPAASLPLARERGGQPDINIPR